MLIYDSLTKRVYAASVFISNEFMLISRFHVEQTITIRVDNADSHVISYFREEDIQSGRLQRPCHSRRDIASVIIPLSAVHQTKFRHPPRISMGPNNMATV